MATSNFDFKSYNDLIKSANSGLRLYLALRLLEDVEGTMRRFDSPLKRDIADIVDEVKQLRADNKKYLESRERTSSGEIDNENLPTDTPPAGDSYQNKHGSKPEDHKEQPAT